MNLAVAEKLTRILILIILSSSCDSNSDSQAVQKVTLVTRAVGIEIHHPDRWTPNQNILNDGGPLILNNFSSKYLAGGIIPNGGAEIAVHSQPKSGYSIEENVRSDAEGAELLKEELIVSALTDRQIMLRTYLERYTEHLVLERSVVYVQRDGHIYRFSISYNNGDKKKEDYKKDFKSIVASATSSEGP